MEKETSIVFFTGTSTGGKIHRSMESLFEKHIHNIAGDDEKLVALTSDGCYYLDSGQQLPYCDFKATSFCVGKSTRYMLSSNSDIYSWGEGAFGELGLGLWSTQSEIPIMLKQDQGMFKLISCGKSHAATIDSVGNAYSWGQVKLYYINVFIRMTTNFFLYDCLT